jgi:hypothetical protein
MAAANAIEPFNLITDPNTPLTPMFRTRAAKTLPGSVGLRAAMQDEHQFEQFVRAGLAQYGLGADDVELQVMKAAERMYGPLRDALLASDLSDVPPEVALDPSRAPSEL